MACACAFVCVRQPDQIQAVFVSSGKCINLLAPSAINLLWITQIAMSHVPQSEYLIAPAAQSYGLFHPEQRFIIAQLPPSR
jgi:hypothetical protein